mmetsp:Transcript_91796/g.163379  ORF Transcript_91796/g.163379 Transcript_91796/m.163379 type:complete len:166 (+) Transcript_91796:59-556(+)|eukprot:CAMPEP_0197630474 /NCGR_PEP_ID=MMETSP1338-20131121/7946_1 /TAXON_ID=43686 ORGANISM="Pelagodinium beii, Strain RCC1491" /NCGR_SAMPLE_ID=MMETSP1338 /ASSEMBLY_ACC=CAM_ASM_000754 /LENGTH=165 /DNA_ID=CAMNT_0043201695 /DNA_START=59 /DNA_END=556 /DNA_ORIENTATION=-
MKASVLVASLFTVLAAVSDQVEEALAEDSCSESLELRQLRGEVELHSFQQVREEEGLQTFSKLREDSPYWCAKMSSIAQKLVPPCWFGSPDPEPDDLPAGYPHWCKYVPSAVRGTVPNCAEPGSTYRKLVDPDSEKNDATATTATTETTETTAYSGPLPLPLPKP